MPAISKLTESNLDERRKKLNTLFILLMFSKASRFMNKEVLTIEDRNTMRFIGAKEIAQLMGCSVPVARQIMHRPDFPLVKCGKNFRVMISEFTRWASERRV